MVTSGTVHYTALENIAPYALIGQMKWLRQVLCIIRP